MTNKNNRILVRLLSLAAPLALTGSAFAQTRTTPLTETRYLAFQVFTGTSNPAQAIGDSGMQPLSAIPSQAQLHTFVQDITHRIGSVGKEQTRLAVIFGPLAFDQSDAEVRRLIASAFAIALAQKVAVGFHIDDSMFWARRSDLWRNPDTVEWRDWNGTPTTGRRIDWGPQPKKIPPQMCFNSKAIQTAVRHRAAVIGKAIQAGINQLKKQGKEDLFAGAIVGWETQIGLDFDTGQPLGYHALTHRGFSKNHPPPDMDKEREKIVQEFITFWCKALADTGIAPRKIYSHTAFIPHKLFDGQPAHTPSYSQVNHFAPPSVAFGQFHRPGFSTYPQPGNFAQIYAEVAQHKQWGWASSEGTNLQLGGGPGQSGMNMETYLAKMFNHGATLTNIFSWGVGGEANKKMDFRVMTEGEEALQAYRKFLRGERLTEAATTTSFMDRLPAKIHRIQKELPTWIQKTGKQAQAQPLMQKLDAAVQANDFKEAEKIADTLLSLLKSE